MVVATTTKPTLKEALNLIPAAGYIRMSTDKQEDSPDRQRGEINRMAERLGYKIVCWYEDHGMTGTESKKRDEFQRMLVDAKTGRFEAILLYELSRMSREDPFEAIEHWRKLRDAKVQIVTCQRGPVDFNNLGGFITAIVDQHGSHDEVVKLSHRSVSGKNRTLANGGRIGGKPFAYDRQIIDDAGKVVKIISHRENFSKPKGWKSKLILSADKAAVAAVRFAFEAVASGQSIQFVAREFLRRGVKSRKGSGLMRGTDIKSMLTNPVYAGCLRAGAASAGKFNSITSVFIEDAHPAIVSRALFDAVQQQLTLRYKRKRTAKPGTYLLNGLVYCGHCGLRMQGSYRERGREMYKCIGHRVTGECEGGRPCISMRALEKNVLRIVDELLLKPNEEVLAGCDPEEKPTVQNEHIAEIFQLQANISRATENLALAPDRQQFQDISRRISDWREREAELQAAIRNSQQISDELRTAKNTIAEIRAARSKMKSVDYTNVDRVALQNALFVVLQSISVTRRSVGDRVKYRMIECEITCRPGIADGKVQFRGLDGTHYGRWVEVLNAISTEQPIETVELAGVVGLEIKDTAKHCRRLEAAGFITRTLRIRPAGCKWQLTNDGRRLAE